MKVSTVCLSFLRHLHIFQSPVGIQNLIPVTSVRLQQGALFHTPQLQRFVTATRQQIVPIDWWCWRQKGSIISTTSMSSTRVKIQRPIYTLHLYGEIDTRTNNPSTCYPLFAATYLLSISSAKGQENYQKVGQNRQCRYIIRERH